MILLRMQLVSYLEGREGVDMDDDDVCCKQC